MSATRSDPWDIVGILRRYEFRFYLRDAIEEGVA